jgi:hypothetical protein
LNVEEDEDEHNDIGVEEEKNAKKRNRDLCKTKYEI